MNFKVNADLTVFTTFRTTATAAKLFELEDKRQLTNLSKALKQQDFIVLGSGANVLFASDYRGTVIINHLKGIELIRQDSQSVHMEIAAGEIWHDVVCQMSAKGYYGLENLALIPGTVGASPVQNIGAYGVEAADFITAVKCFDLIEHKIKIFYPQDCCFAYRDSIFKTPEYRRRYLITAVTFKLAKVFSPVLTYKELSEKIIGNASDLLTQVIAIRQEKLPDPKVLGNAGSFFKNPVISQKQLKALQRQYANIPHFTMKEQQIKIPAAWLIEQAGFKGTIRENGAGVYAKHALILVNHANARGSDIADLATEIISAVVKQFAIVLQPEVLIV